MTNKFAKYFNTSIWRRGQSYVDAGRVQNLKKINRKTYHATVIGDDTYQVEITVEAPVKMTCSCPHAQAGNRCKHMAAVFAAYEKSSTSNEVVKPYTSYPWYQKIKSYITRSGNIKDEYDFAQEMKNCIFAYERSSSAQWQATLDSCIAMMRFMNTLDSYFYDDVMQLLIDYLHEARCKAGEKEKTIYDDKVAEILPDITDEDVLDYFFESYFPYEDNNYKRLYECIKKADYDVKLNYVYTILDHFIYHKVPEEEVLSWVQPWMDNVYVQDKLCEYYEQMGEYEKAIHTMEQRVFSNSGVNEDLIRQKMKLFVLYTKVHRTSNRDALFEQLLKDRRVDKEKLFQTYKNMVSEEEWRVNGRKKLLAWAKNKQTSTTMPLYHRLQEGSLIFEQLFKEFTLYDLDDVQSALKEYDPGLLYSMYKASLKSMLMNEHNDVNYIFYQFRIYYPDDEASLHACRYILAELKEEFKGNRRIEKVIEKMEDEIYEEE